MTQEFGNILVLGATGAAATGAPLGLIGGIAGGLLALGLLIWMCHKPCPAGKILVILGRGTQGRTFRWIQSGAAFVVPGVHRHRYLDTDAIWVELEREWCETCDGRRIWVSATYSICLSTEPEQIARAVYRLIDHGEDEISEVCSGIVAAAVRRTFSRISSQDAAERRMQLEKICNEAIQTQLSSLGMELISGRIRQMSGATELPIAS